MIFSFRKFAQQIFGSSRTTRRRPARRRTPTFRPRLRQLEDRTLLSSISWIGTNGDWDTASNWSSNHVPTAADDVVISPSSAITITHASGNQDAVHSLTSNSNTTIDLSGGSLTLGSGGATVSGPLTLAGGTLTGPGNLSIAGLFSWTAGTMSGSGTTTADGGIALNGTNTSENLDTRTLVNANSGTANWTGSNNTLFLTDGALFENLAGSTFNVGNDQGMFPGGFATGEFLNAGTFTKSPTTGTTTLDVLFNNSGTVNVNSGTLAVDAGGTSTGTFNVASGDTLNFVGGSSALSSTSTLAGAGTVLFTSGTTVDTGTVSMTGTITVTGGTAEFDSSFSVPTLNVSAGNLTGSGAITVSGTLNWSNGTMSGTGSTTIASAATMNINGINTNEVLDTRTLNNAGTTNWSGVNNIGMDNGATFNNQSTGAFNAQNNQVIVYFGGVSPVINNAGTFTKSPTPGVTEIGTVPFNNTGTVNVNSGTLRLDGGGTDTGTFNIASPATLNFSGNNTGLSSTSTLAGAGTVLFTGGFTDVLGTVNMTGTITVTGGGTAEFDSNFSVPTLNVSGGNLTGSGAITVSGTLNWSGGTMSGTGSTTIASTAALNINGVNTSEVLDTRTLNNAGTATWSGVNNIGMDNGATFNNQSTGAFNAQNDQVIQYFGGVSPVINNAGTFTKSITTGVTEIFSGPFNNTGTVNVNSGTLRLDGGGTDTGTFNVNSPTLSPPAAPTLATATTGGTIAAGTYMVEVTYTSANGETLASSASSITTSGSTSTITIDSPSSVTGATGWKAYMTQAGGTTFTLQGGVNALGTNLTLTAPPTSTGPAPPLTNTAMTSINTLNFNGNNTGLTSTSKLAGAGSVLFTNGFTDVAGAVNITAGGISVAGGTAEFTSNFSLPTLNVSGGTLTGPSAITVTSALGWTGGTMSGTGSTTLQVPTTGVVPILSINGVSTTEVLDTRSLNNAGGTVNWSGSNNIGMANGATMNNEKVAVVVNGVSRTFTGTFNAQNDQAIQYFGGVSPVINNAGIFLKSPTPGVTEIGTVPFNNTGTVTVSSGTLRLDGGGTDSGTMSVASAANLNFNGNVFNISATISGTGTVQVTNGTVVDNGTYSPTTTNVSGGTLFLNKTGIKIANLNLSGGTLSGIGTITVSKGFDWNGGTMTGTGSTTIASTVTAGAINGINTTEVLDTRTLNNAGTLNWSGPNNIGMANGAVFSNQSTGKFKVQNDQLIQNFGGVTSSFNNAGTFTKSITTGVTEISSGPFNNTGTVTVSSGTLRLDTGGTDTKAFNVASGATLNFNGNNTGLSSTSSLAGAGTVLFTSGTTVDTGTVSMTGSITVTGGTAEFDSSFSVPTLNVSGGNLTGSGAITVSGTLNWSGGTMSGTGSTSTSSTAALNINGVNTNEVLDTRTLNNAGTATWSNNNTIGLVNGAAFNNQATGTFSAQNDNNIQNFGGVTSSFNNAGSFTKSPSNGTTEVPGVVFNNTGIVTVSTGTLRLDGGGTDTGTFNVASPATLNFNGNNTSLSSTSSLAGAGTVLFTNGFTSFLGTVSMTGSITVQGGTAEFDSNFSVPTLNVSGGNLTGSAAITVSGTLNWGGGTMSGTGSTIIPSTAALNINGVNTSEVLDTRTLNNAGTATWSNNNTIGLVNGAAFNNQATGTFSAQNDNNIGNFGGVTSSFNNAGTFTKSPSNGTTEVPGVVFNNTGTVTVSTGTLRLDGGGTDTGTFNVASPATLNFNGNNTSLSSTSSLAGAGTVLFTSGTTVDTGTASMTGTITVTGGTAEFDSSFSVPTLNVSGGNLTGSGAITVSGTLNWSGGTMSGTGSTIIPSTAALNINGVNTNEVLDTRTLNNAGTATWSNNNTIGLVNGAAFNNQATGTFSAQNDNNIQNFGGVTSSFNNAGSFTKSPSTGTTEVPGVVFNNTGTVTVSTGTLKLDSGGTGGGTWSVASGATLNFNGGNFDLNASPSITEVSGAGALLFSTGGETDIAGIYNITGATSVTGGTVDFLNNASTGTFSNTGGTVVINNPASGTTTFSVGSGNYAQTGGSTFLNGATLDVTSGNAVSIQGGNFSGEGTVNGNFSNAANLFVGGQGTTGILTINGNFTQTSAGSLFIDIGGTTAGSQFDQINITGTNSATLSGTLNLSDINGFSPATGTTFTIMTYGSESGDFTTKNLGGFSSATAGSTSYTVTK